MLRRWLVLLAWVMSTATLALSLHLPFHAGFSPLSDRLLLERQRVVAAAEKRSAALEDLGGDGHLINGHMLKQPLLRFDILWRKFAGQKLSVPGIGWE